MVAERVERSSGKHADLAHACAEHLAQAMCLDDLRLASGERRAHRGAQALREADADRIEGAGELREGYARRRGRVPQAGAVEVKPDVEVAGSPRDGGYVLAREDAAPGPVVRVLDRNERSAWVVVGTRLDGGFHLCGREEAAPSRNGKLNARERGPRARFEPAEVGSLSTNDFVTPPGVGHDGQLIAHRSRGDEERC